MKRYNEQQRTGHLLAFIGKENCACNFSLFLPVHGLEEFDTLLNVSAGFETCFNAAAGHNDYTFHGFSINDIGRAREVFPEIDEDRTLRFDLAQFIDDRGNFIDDFASTIISRFICNLAPVLPDIRTGAIATGSDFYNREHEIILIREKIAAGKNVLLQSSRRYGKSSLLKYIQGNPSRDWKVCYFDLQGGKSAEDFLELMVDGLMRSKDCVSCLPANLASSQPWQQTEAVRVELKRHERGKIRAGWREYGAVLLKTMETTGNRVLLILDEFSYMLEDMLETDGDEMVQNFMKWFSEERQKAHNVSFILAGSVHIQTFLRHHDIDGKIDDLEPVHISLLAPKTAASFILLLFAREGVSVRKSEIDTMLGLMGEPIPYFLQVFVDLLSSGCRRRGELSTKDIEDIYYQQLLGPDSKRHFESVKQQLERYERYKPGGRQAAGEMLLHLSEKTGMELGALKTIWADHTGSAEKFNEILDIMKDDFYIEEKDGIVYFMSKLIGDWWAKHGA
jgi:hypothetical protein